MKLIRLSVPLVAVALTACSSNPAARVPTDDAFNRVHEVSLGTLWIQTSGEYEAISAQTYRQVVDRMKEALVDPSWTAAIEQEGADYESLPPAIVVDVDETVLDNSPYEARLVESGESFSEESWNAWCREAAAKPLVGALGFAREAEALNVTIFYVTNRDASVEEVTWKNLERAGFPLDDSFDVLMTKGEKESWGSDKTTRRAEIAKTHRILLLLGDDLNDFATGFRADNPEDRRELVREHREKWGRKWHVFPNPVYGSWEASLFGRDYSLSPTEKIERKQQYLETER